MLKQRLGIGLLLLALSGCGGGHRAEYPTVHDGLQLTRVVLYRNGVGYFERSGKVDGDILSIRVRKDQINDLLKSLTVVDRQSGKAVSVSMPLDPTTWANAALASLQPGHGNLAQVLDALRGTSVELGTATTSVEGRIVLVEPIELAEPKSSRAGDAPRERDYRVTLLDRDELRVVRLSQVTRVTIRDDDLAMQFHRSLDAASGEGMFQQVDVAIRLAGEAPYDVAVSYVVAAPVWKPTYRVVLPENGKGHALLQGWAVVDNVSGEDWRDVQLSLTSGAPISFRYDLHTPREIERPDRSDIGTHKRVHVAVGETTYDQDAPDEAPAPEAELADDGAEEAEAAPLKKSRSARAAGSGAEGRVSAPAAAPPPAPGMAPMPSSQRMEQKPAVSIEELTRSTAAATKASRASGLVRFDLQDRVTIPDGSATMVAVINQMVDGEETLLYRPGGAGAGYESNPYRVARVRNSTPFVLEPGPISIYSGGSFVGEGLSEAVGSNVSATIPFAVEPDVMITRKENFQGGEVRVLRIVRKVLEVQSFRRRTTDWSAQSKMKDDGFTVLVRHPKAGDNYELRDPPAGTEELPDAYLVPLTVPAKSREGTVRVIEETPARTTISIFSGEAAPLLEKLLLTATLEPGQRKVLEPIVQLRSRLGKLETQIQELEQQRATYDQRAAEERAHLEAIRKNPEAGELRAKISARINDFTSRANTIALQIAKLQQQKMEVRIELEDALEKLDLRLSPK